MAPRVYKASQTGAELHLGTQKHLDGRPFCNALSISGSRGKGNDMLGKSAKTNLSNADDVPGICQSDPRDENESKKETRLGGSHSYSDSVLSRRRCIGDAAVKSIPIHSERQQLLNAPA